MSEEMECQHHANCGGYSVTEEEIGNALCEECLEADKDRDKHQVAVARLAVALREFDLATSDGTTKALANVVRAARAVVKE